MTFSRVALRRGRVAAERRSERLLLSAGAGQTLCSKTTPALERTQSPHDYIFQAAEWGFQQDFNLKCVFSLKRV